MSRYYFHLFNDETIRDDEGVEFPDGDAALQDAARMARGMAAESVLEGRLVLDHRIDVADESGRTIGVVHFGDVIQIKKYDTTEARIS